MPKKLRILALHSFRTSGAIFKEQLTRAGILDQLDELVEITFINAPNPASGPIPDDVAPHFPPPYFEWWNAQRNPDDGTWQYKNANTSLSYLNDIFSLHGPFDGLIGFSQGAATASLVAGMQRSGVFLADSPPIRFLICFAGIRVRDAGLQKYYSALHSLPAVHIIGDRDPVKKMTNHLIEAFDRPVVISHQRGHVIPALKGEDLEALKKFLVGLMDGDGDNEKKGGQASKKSAL